MRVEKSGCDPGQAPGGIGISEGPHLRLSEQTENRAFILLVLTYITEY